MWCKVCNLCNKCKRVSNGTLKVRCLRCGSVVPKGSKKCPGCGFVVPPAPGTAPALQDDEIASS